VSIAQGRESIRIWSPHNFLKKTGAAKPAMVSSLSLAGLLALLVLASFISMRPGLMQSKESAEIHSSCSPVSWEHCWKTDRVIATRYLNPSKGYNIGFRFPRNPYRGDNAVVFEFYQMHGGSRWPAGREQLVRFEGVHDTEGDTEGADRKLQEILPTVSELLEKSWSTVEFAEKTQSNQDRHATPAEAGEMQMTWAALKDRSSTTVRRFLSFP